MEAAPIVKDKEVEDEDLVAPVVPAPEAVARVLAEGRRPSTDLSDQGTTNDTAAALAPFPFVAETASEVSQPSKEDKQAQEDAPTVTHSEDMGVASDQKAATEAPQVEKSITDTVDANAARATSTAAIGELSQPSTPTKNACPADASSNQQAVTGTPGEASPARSGGSTPATATPSGTPTKPGRMSLKERLAEAARKRAQASAPARPSSQVEEPAAAAPAAPLESTAAALASAAAEQPAPEEEESVKMPTAAEAVSKAPAPEAASEMSTTKAEEDVKQAPVEAEAEAAKKEPEEPRQTASQAVEQEQPSQPAESTTPADATDATSESKEAHSEKVATDSVAAEASAEIEPKESADADGDQDDEGDDAGANEGTNDSAVGSTPGTPGAGSKKNKKKKKGKKK